MRCQPYLADEPARGLCTAADIDARIRENMFWAEVVDDYRPSMRCVDAWIVLSITVGSWAAVGYLVCAGMQVIKGLT